MTASSSTQPTIQEEVNKRLRTQQIAAMTQTQSEVTPIPPEREAAFREWVRVNGVRDLDAPDSHYDYRGAFLAGAKPELDPASGKLHWPDTFKQHGHPTFSVESQYSTGASDGGQWVDGKFVAAQQSSSTTTPDLTDKATTLAVEAFERWGGDAQAVTAMDALGHAAEQDSAAVNAFIDLHPSDSLVASQMQQQRSSFPIHFPEELHVGPLGNVIEQAAIQARDAAVGLINATLGSTSAPVPVVSEEEAHRIRTTTGTPGPWGTRIGQQLVQTPHEIEQHQIAAAFVGSSLVGGATSLTILRGLGSGIVKTTLANTAMGAAFGAMRPRYQNESLLGAITTDALLFGGLGLSASFVGKLAKPIKLGVDALEKAGIVIDPKVLRGPEYGKALFEQIQEISNGLDAKGLVPTPDLPFGTLINTTMASLPDNVSPIRRWVGSPSHWDKQLAWGGLLGAKPLEGPIGEAAQRIVLNFRGRMAVALQLRSEWDAVLNEAEHLITKDIPPGVLIGEGAGVRAALVQQRKEALGTLLNNVFQPVNLPVTVPPNMVRAFGLLRDRLLADRETLKLLYGGVADWGIDAYLPHVFAREFAITTVAGDGAEQILAFANIKDLRGAAMKIIGENPGIAIRILPTKLVHHTELYGIGLTGQMLNRFIRTTAKSLSVDADEVADVLFKNHIVRVKPNKKFYGHAQQRGDPALAGWEADPFTAIRTYAAGFARAAAFHDAEQKAGAVIEALGRLPGTEHGVSLLQTYVDRVLGRPAKEEMAFRDWWKNQVKRAAALTRVPGIQQLAEDFGDPAVSLSKLGVYEANIRLGYNPTAWFANMTQTATNTAAAIGWGPTMRGIRLFLDRSQHAQVDALLRALDVNLAIPLTAADQITIRNLGQVDPWHPLYLFNKIETANRAIAGLAKYQEQILGGAGIREALDAARTFIKDTNFDYSLADAPKLLQSQLGATAFQFKKYLFKQTEFFAQLPPAGKARFMAAYWALGGVAALMSLPPLLLLDWAVGELTGEKISERLQAAFPRASRGLPGFAGVDLGGNIAMGNPGGMGPGWSDVVGPGIVDLFTIGRDVLLEPAYKGIGNLIMGKQGHLSPADKANAMAQLVPVVARRVVDAYDILTSGVVHARGTAQLKFTPGDVEREAVLTAFGFRSLQRSEEQRVTTTIRREVSLHNKEEQAVVQAWANAYVEGNSDLATQLLQDAQSDGLIITREQLRDALAGAILERSTRAVKGAPKELRVKELQRLQQIRP